ncbi:MAG TPA: hypothetical protein VFE62_17670 [Gemmataceae bacterium]|nr:hypothetical protein [Gemmataceae bacterium]
MSDTNIQPESQLPAPAPAPQPPAPPPPNNAWIYFFAFLVVASVTVTLFMIWFNNSIQLKRPELDAAYKLWKEKGPKTYNLVYTEQLNNDDHKTKFFVKVRDGKVQEVLMDGKPLEPTKEDGEVHDPRPYHSMDAKFRDVERFMSIDEKKDAPRVYVIATFDPETGAILRYIRRVMGTTQRVELNFKFVTEEK